MPSREGEREGAVPKYVPLPEDNASKGLAPAANQNYAVPPTEATKVDYVPRPPPSSQEYASAAPAARQPVGQYLPPNQYVTPVVQQIVVPIPISGAVMESSYMPWQLMPQRCICACCKADVITDTRPAVGLINHVAACFCCFVGCWLGCCLVPYMVDGLS